MQHFKCIFYCTTASGWQPKSLFPLLLTVIDTSYKPVSYPLFWNDIDKIGLEITNDILKRKNFLQPLWRCFPGGANGQESARQCRRCGFEPLVGKILWRRKWQTTPVFLPGKSHGQWSLVGYSPQGRKEQDTTQRLKQQQSLSFLNSSFTKQPLYSSLFSNVFKFIFYLFQQSQHSSFTICH